MDLALQLLVNGVINGSHYALLGVGFGIIFATTRIVHFAYGPVFTVAAYVAWYAAAVMGLPIAVALLVAILVAVLLGVGSYVLLYEPFEKRQAPHLVPLIASLGLYIVLENLVGIIFGSGVRVVREFNNGIHFMGPVFFTTVHIWQVALLVILAAALAVFLRWSSYGKAVLAMTDNIEMARIIGIDTRKVAILVFAIGSAISAPSAVLILLKDGATTHMGFLAVFMAFVAVIVGGIGSIKGAIIGGFALGMVESLGMWRIPTEWQSSIAFMLLFLVVLLRPQGLFGAAMRR